jgi:hypothetical protein
MYIGMPGEFVEANEYYYRYGVPTGKIARHNGKILRGKQFLDRYTFRNDAYMFNDESLIGFTDVDLEKTMKFVHLHLRYMKNVATKEQWANVAEMFQSLNWMEKQVAKSYIGRHKR